MSWVVRMDREAVERFDRDLDEVDCDLGFHSNVAKLAKWD